MASPESVESATGVEDEAEVWHKVFKRAVRALSVAGPDPDFVEVGRAKDDEERALRLRLIEGGIRLAAKGDDDSEVPIADFDRDGIHYIEPDVMPEGDSLGVPAVVVQDLDNDPRTITDIAGVSNRYLAAA